MCFLTLRMRLRVHWASGFPCALRLERLNLVHGSGEFASREAHIFGTRLQGAALTIHASAGTADDVARLSQAPVIASLKERRSIRAVCAGCVHSSKCHLNLLGARMASDQMSEEQPERRFRTLFISDVHLGARGSQADKLLDFLRVHDADTIYLVGDIVDGWALK